MRILFLSLLGFLLSGGILAQSSRHDGFNTDNNELRGPGSDNVPLNGSGYLGQTYNQTLCGLSYVQSTKMITTRYVPDPGTGLPCILPITSIPSCSIIEKAYLYWIVSYQPGSSTTPTVNLGNPLGSSATYSA